MQLADAVCVFVRWCSARTPWKYVLDPQFTHKFMASLTVGLSNYFQNEVIIEEIFAFLSVFFFSVKQMKQ